MAHRGQKLRLGGVGRFRLFARSDQILLDMFAACDLRPAMRRSVRGARLRETTPRVTRPTLTETKPITSARLVEE